MMRRSITCLRLLASDRRQRSSYICHRCQSRLARPAYPAYPATPFQRRTLRTRPQAPRKLRAQLEQQDHSLVASPTDNAPAPSSEAVEQSLSGDQTSDVRDRLQDESAGINTQSLLGGDDKKYDTWRKLRRMTPAQWDEYAAKEYEGFTHPDRKHKARQQIESAVHKALIEVFLLQQDGRPLEMACDGKVSRFSRTHMAASTFKLEEGKIVLQTWFPNEGQREEGQEPYPEYTEATKTSEQATEDAQRPVVGSEAMSPQIPNPAVSSMKGGQIPSNSPSQSHTPNHGPMLSGARSGPVDQSWKELPLQDPHLKFAVLKRVSQLLGLRIPDPSIASIESAADLVDTLSKKPKQRKLQLEIKDLGVLKGVRNLQWGAKSQDQKDQEVGSLKVIREELHRIRLMTPEQRAWALGE